jgi:hypothetical protein
MYGHLFRDFYGKPLAKRLNLWRFRKELRQKLVVDRLSRSALSAASGETTATSPPFVKQETERKRNFEEPPFADPSAQLRDNLKKKLKFKKIEHADGSAPFMSPLYVAFATKCVELLRKRNTLTGRQLIELWNQDLADVLSTAESARHGRGQNSTKKRTISLKTATFLCRNYIRWLAWICCFQFQTRGLQPARTARTPSSADGSALADACASCSRRGRRVPTSGYGGRVAHGPARPPASTGGRGGAGAGGGARPPAAMGAAAGMPRGGGSACPCAEGAVDPRSAAAAAAWWTSRRADGVRDEAKGLR